MADALSPTPCPDCGLPPLLPLSGQGTEEDPYYVDNDLLWDALVRHVQALPEMHPTLATPTLPRRVQRCLRSWLRRSLRRVERWVEPR
ncbi:hypothetical protein IL38_23855 [Actinopolyspora erythraea]|uniref:Uncharacterized protein n=1 Tax=Actinopolyspora erythraea TaxID=414996 RepID=A0ABR4WY78_9ACTN|nr:hypothetical protein [Actinopolyspora erythraea]KGI79345.1 hypothetical protein IL38_23855 [Actinopolyspora erythraea]